MATPPRRDPSTGLVADHDPTESAIRNAFAEGMIQEQEHAAHVLALRLAEAKLESARRAMMLARDELVTAPASYVTDDGKGNDSYGEGRSIVNSISRDRQAIERRLATVREEIARAENRRSS